MQYFREFTNVFMCIRIRFIVILVATRKSSSYVIRCGLSVIALKTFCRMWPS